MGTTPTKDNDKANIVKTDDKILIKCERTHARMRDETDAEPEIYDIVIPNVTPDMPISLFFQLVKVRSYCKTALPDFYPAILQIPSFGSAAEWRLALKRDSSRLVSLSG